MIEPITEAVDDRHDERKMLGSRAIGLSTHDNHGQAMFHFQSEREARIFYAEELIISVNVRYIILLKRCSLHHVAISVIIHDHTLQLYHLDFFLHR